jgi:outer membrane protein assembly factor BamB
MTSLRPIVGLVTVGILTAQPILAQDWPQWRGAQRDGRAAGFVAPAAWPGELTRQWSVPVGQGDATPALVGDRLYAFGRRDADEQVICLSAADGRELWKYTYAAEHVVTGPPAQHNGPRSSPVVVDGKVVTLGVGGIVTCLNATDGTLLWRKASQADFLETAYKADTAMSILVADGLCIVHVGNGGAAAILAFDLSTGQPRWKLAGQAPQSASPMLLVVGGVRQFVTFNDRNMLGVSLAEGKILWQFPFPSNQPHHPSPIVAGDTIYYTGPGRGLGAVKIEKAGDTFTATALWSKPNLSARFATPVLRDGRLFTYVERGGSIQCINAASGDTIWADTQNRGQHVSLVDAGAAIFALSMNGDLIAFAPDGDQFKQLATYKVSTAESWAHPIIAGNRIFIRDKENLALWTLK